MLSLFCFIALCLLLVPHNDAMSASFCAGQTVLLFLQEPHRLFIGSCGRVHIGFKGSTFFQFSKHGDVWGGGGARLFGAVGMVVDHPFSVLCIHQFTMIGQFGMGGVHVFVFAMCDACVAASPFGSWVISQSWVVQQGGGAIVAHCRC